MVPSNFNTKLPPPMTNKIILNNMTPIIMIYTRSIFNISAPCSTYSFCNNDGYLSIKSTHENFFGKVFGAHPESGVDFPDFCKIAKAYGIQSYRLNSSKKLESIADILSTYGPVVIELVIDIKQEFFPKLKSRMGDDGKFITPDLDDMFPFLSQEVLQKIRMSAECLTTGDAKL